MWSNIAVSVTSPATTIAVGAQTALAFTGTVKPTALEKNGARITSIKVKWPTGEIQSYNPNLPAGTVTVTGVVTSVANQNWTVSVTPVLATSGTLLLWAEDSWGFYTDTVAFSLTP
ncbi:MAG: hypothetical protein KF713_00315 [Turneriella sp.]|nr:hypothetical protein [Turneriella sp.]